MSRTLPTPAGRTRQAVQDTINGDIDQVDSPTMRALLVIATSVDQVESRIDGLSNKIMTIGGGIITSVIATAIMLALSRS